MFKFLLTGAVTSLAVASIAPAAAEPPPLPPAAKSAGEIVEPPGVLRLQDALALALASNPRLSAFSWNGRIAEAERLQAGVRPSPEIGLTVQEFGGSEARKGFNAAETTLALSQLVELGGKRAMRLRVAAFGRDLAAWDYEVARLDVLAETTAAFAAVLAAQEQLRLTKESLDLAQQVTDAVAARVRAGKVSPIEETRAAAALSQGRIAVATAERNLEAARAALAATWGGSEPVFAHAEGAYAATAEIAPLPQLFASIGRNPDLARWKTEMGQREARLALEQARAVPDPTISAGVTRFEETEENALLLGISIPLPIFGLNPGGVAAARANLGKGFQERRAAEVTLRARLTRAYKRLSAALTEARALERDVLPRAEDAYAAIRTGYEAGKFGFLDVLDAQRSLFAARQAHVEALAAFHAALAETERLAGRPVATLSETGEIE